MIHRFLVGAQQPTRPNGKIEQKIIYYIQYCNIFPCCYGGKDVSEGIYEYKHIINTE